MKLLHTADWHLGKIVNGVSMLDEQRYILRQIIEIAKQEEVDGIIIAGDLYDKSVPPTEAVKLLNDTLYELNVLRKIPIFAISGNHDSAERLSFGTAWYEQNNLYLAGKLTYDIMPVEWGDAQFWLVPYHDAITTRAIFKQDAIKTFDDAMKVVVDQIKLKQDPNKLQVFIGHAFIAGGIPTDSERQLSIGQVDRVAKDHFACFDYTALGHLHNPNALIMQKIGYSGSPLKYSFSEAKEVKSVRIIELNLGKEIDITIKALKPRNDMRIIEGLLADLLANPGVNPDDYLQVNLLDDGALVDPMGQLRQIFPNVLHLERRKHKLNLAVGEQFEDVMKADEKELFSRFFTLVSGKDMSKTQIDLIENVITSVKRGEK
ncbi:MAG: exonuclease SbcCD subunit D [Culicoidibacterales bacterium]